jgi:hypothetical protein
MIKLEACNETRFYDCPEALFEHIGQVMGRDVQDYLNMLNLSPELKCTGECDKTYRIEEHYQRMIRDFVEDLELLLKGKRFDREKLQRIIKDMMKEL